MRVFLFIILLSHARADILSDIFLNDEDDCEEVISDSPKTEEPEHYSWDNIYLEEYPTGVEVVYEEE